MSEDSTTQTVLTALRDAYTAKINAAIAANDDKLAIELSTQFREEAFVTLFGRAPRRRNVA